MKRKKKKAKKRLFLFLFVLISLIGTLIYNVIDFSKEVSYEVQKIINIKQTDYKYTVIKNTIITLENNELIIHTENESHHHTFSGDFSDAALNSIGNKVYVTDKKKGKIYIVDLSGNICNQISFDQKILSIKEDREENFIGFHVRKDDGTENLIFFDENGTETGGVKGIKGGSIIDFFIDSAEGNIAISIITHEKDIKSNILFADIHGHIHSGKIFNDEIFPSVFLIEKGGLICVGDKRIIKLNRNKEIVWEEKIIADRAEYSFFNDGLIVCTSEIGKTNVIMLGTQKDIRISEAVNGNIKGIESNGSRTILYGDRSLFLLKNTSLEETKLTKDIIWADLLSNGNIIIGSNNKIEILKKESVIQ